MVQKLVLNDMACYKSPTGIYDLIVVLLVLGDALLCRDCYISLPAEA